MRPSELTELAYDIINQRCKRQNVELKRAAKGTPQKLYDTLSSLSNQVGGGVILFGIDERRTSMKSREYKTPRRFRQT